MKCFFGHKYGRIQTDGFQYCERCGNANKPHPCANGHIWKEVGECEYSGWSNDGFYKSEWRDFKIALVCSVCGERSSRWKFGH